METPFEIVRLTADMVKHFSADVEPPHRHNHEEVVIFTKGGAEHFIDFNKEPVVAPIIIYIAQGKIHQFLLHPNSEGWIIKYKNEFIPQGKFNYYSNFLDTINYTFETSECLSKWDTLCDMMLDEYQQPEPDFVLIKYLLSAFLAKLEGESRKRMRPETGAVNTYQHTFNSFLKILEDNYKRAEGVQFYADKLNMSVRNLNLICQSIFNKSITEIIETRKLIEARQLLLNSTLSISEIGFELGYAEKSYFSRTFHKKTGLTPSEFRAQMISLVS